MKEFLCSKYQQSLSLVWYSGRRRPYGMGRWQAPCPRAVLIILPPGRMNSGRRDGGD